MMQINRGYFNPLNQAFTEYVACKSWKKKKDMISAPSSLQSLIIQFIIINDH